MNQPLTKASRILALLGLTAGVAHAEAPGIDPEDAVQPVAVVEGAGVKVGEGTVLHPQIGVEVGVQSNVFFEDTNVIAAGLIRLIAEIGTGSLSPQRLTPAEQDTDAGPGPRAVGDFQYRADLRAQYDYYPSTNDSVSSQGGLGGGLLFRGIVHPERPVQFAVVEDYARQIRPTNFESSDSINRDVNHLKLQLQWAPSGRSIAGILHYENTIDVFEKDTQHFANRFQNTLGLRIQWQWLPQTRIYGDVSGGIYTGLGSTPGTPDKVTSYPLTTAVGIQTLLTPRITFTSRIGYENGFYASGPSFSSILFGAQAGYRYSELGRVTLGYNYVHQDSINANYYRDHAITLGLTHAINPFVILVQAGLTFRQYDGLIVTSGTPMDTRSDVIGAITAQAHYNFRDWLAASIDYHFTDVQTDYTYTTADGFTDNPSFVRHEVLAGIRAAY